MHVLLVTAVLVFAGGGGSVDRATDPALAATIHRLFAAAFATDAPDSNVAEVRKIFAERGLPTIAMVGPEAAEDYIILSASEQPLEFTRQVLAAAQRTPGGLPPHAVPFLAARVKQKAIESGLRAPYPNARLTAR